MSSRSERRMQAAAAAAEKEKTEEATQQTQGQQEKVEATSSVIVEELQPKVINDAPAAVQEQGQQKQVETPAPVAPVKVETVHVEKKAPVTKDEFQARVDSIRLNGTPMQKVIVDWFDDYAIKMEPSRRMDDKEMLRHQAGMWTMFKTVLTVKDAEEFKRLWNMVLAMFLHYDKPGSAFSDTAIHRGAWLWSEGDNRLYAMTNLINIVKLTANQETRARGMKQFDMERSLSAGFTPEERTRLLAFYGK